MPQRICSNDSNQFSNFTIWYTRGTVNIYPYSDAPMLKLGADLQYLISIGRTPILVTEYGPDGFQNLETSEYAAYAARYGTGAFPLLPDGGHAIGSITDDGFPTCYAIPRIGPGLCPPGYVYDVATEMCVPLPPPPPIVPPPIPPIIPPVIGPPPGPPPPVTPPPLGQPDPEGDEITDTLCRQIAADTAAIVHAINQLKGDGGAGAVACCAAIVNAIAGIEATLIRILTILPALAPSKAPPFDVTAVVTELTCICEQLTALASSSSAIPTSLDTGLKSISDAIANTKPTDVSGIVEQLKSIVGQGDVDQAIFNALEQQGLLTAADLQSLQGIKWSDAITYILNSHIVRSVEHFIDTVGGDAGVIANEVKTALAPIGNWAERVLVGSLKLERNVIQTALEIPLKLIISTLVPALPTQIGNIGVNPDTVLADVASVGFNLWGICALIGLKFPGAAEALMVAVEAIIGVLGFEELEEVQIGPLVHFGIARQAEMQAKNMFRQELPGVGQLTQLVARGLWDVQRYSQTVGYTGLPTELIEPVKDAAYSGLNARMMLRLVGTGLFSDADVVDELTFAGMRQVSQHRLVLAAAYLGTEPERSKLRSALERFYTAGMISDNDLVSRLESAEHNTDRTNLVLETVQLEKQIVLAKEYEGAYSREFLAGLLDAPGYQSALEGLGMQPPDVAARLFRDETHLNVTTAIQAARQARALQRAEASAERKAAIESYRTGSSNAATLAASLLATGLSPAQVAALTTYQTLAAAGVLRWIYGLRLPPSQATLLRQRVSDLTRQREIGMLTDAQYVSALTALNIPSNYVNALRAGANARISPKTAAVLTPVSTT